MLTRTVYGRTYTYSHCIGRGTNGGEGFRYPLDLALASDDVVYVVNGPSEFMASSRITKCTLGSELGDEEFIMDIGAPGEGDGEFTGITSIALDKDENLYVSDEVLNRITIFDKDGNFVDKWGVHGSGDGEIDRPWGLAFDVDENLWVVDSGNNRVQTFTKDGKSLGKWGSGGSGEGQFNMAWGLALDGNGDVYVADWRNSRVQKFSPDGTYLMSFGAPGSGDGALRRPSGVAVDDDGDVYVADWGEDVVQAYGPDGEHLTTFQGDAQQLPKWGLASIVANPDMGRARKRVKSLEREWRFDEPAAVKIDDKRRIVICEVQRSRLQVYVKEKDYVDPQFNL